MEVILLEKIAKLGPLGTQLRVKPGFARNYLIPQGKALPATASNIERFEAKRAELEQKSAEKLQASYARAAELEGFIVTVQAQASEDGRLFGSVTPADIVQALAETGHTVQKSEVRLPEGPIRQVGEYEVELHLQGADVIAKIRVSVVEA